MSPLEKLRQSMANPAGTLAPENRPGAMLGEQQQIQRLSQAQAGKATTPGAAAPRLSNIGEQIAARETALAGMQLQQQGQVQAAEVAQQEQAIQDELGLQLEELDERRLAQEQYRVQQAQTLLDQFTTGQRQLDLNKHRSTMEQAAFNLRLNNNKYIKQLQDVGRKARLDSKVRFQEELARSIFAEEESMFYNDLLFRSMINARGRDFTSQLGQIDLDFALQMANAQNQAAGQRMVWEGVGGLVSGGIAAYEKPKAKVVAPGNTDVVGANQPGPVEVIE